MVTKSDNKRWLHKAVDLPRHREIVTKDDSMNCGCITFQVRFHCTNKSLSQKGTIMQQYKIKKNRQQDWGWSFGQFGQTLSRFNAWFYMNIFYIYIDVRKRPQLTQIALAWYWNSQKSDCNYFAWKFCKPPTPILDTWPDAIETSCVISALVWAVIHTLVRYQSKNATT